MKVNRGLILGALVIFFTISVTLVFGQVKLDPSTLTKFMDPLPIPGVMQPVEEGGTYYEVGAWQKTQQLHSQLPPTTV